VKKAGMVLAVLLLAYLLWHAYWLARGLLVMM
jgi:hypothetical protein